MENIYYKIELKFEHFTSKVTRILGHAITFMAVFILVIFWWASNLFTSHNIHQNIADIISGFSFLCLFVIQKSVNRYSALSHLKLNELISSHEPANNAVMDTSKKTEHEIVELSKEYIEIIEEIEEAIENGAD